MRSDRHVKVSHCHYINPCDRKWDDLIEVVDVTSVRYCSECENTVHECSDLEKLNEHRSKGHCVVWLEPNTFEMPMGKPITTEELEELKDEFRLAAEQGDSQAQFKMGDLCLGAFGELGNFKEAYVWFSLAAANGYEEAFTERSRLEQRLTPAQLDQAQALAWRFFERYQPKTKS